MSDTLSPKGPAPCGGALGERRDGGRYVAPGAQDVPLDVVQPAQVLLLGVGRRLYLRAQSILVRKPFPGHRRGFASWEIWIHVCLSCPQADPTIIGQLATFFDNRREHSLRDKQQAVQSSELAGKCESAHSGEKVIRLKCAPPLSHLGPQSHYAVGAHGQRPPSRDIAPTRPPGKDRLERRRGWSGRTEEISAAVSTGLRADKGGSIECQGKDTLPPIRKLQAMGPLCRPVL